MECGGHAGFGVRSECRVMERGEHAHKYTASSNVTRAYRDTPPDKQQTCNGSASDSSSEGCVFKSRPGHYTYFETFKTLRSLFLTPPSYPPLVTFCHRLS